ncbi:MAG: SRPBCC family protein [Nocardioidaceae bacterium]
MELSHQFTVPTSIDAAWEAFNDLERIAPCFPGASLTSFDGDTFEGICKVKLGPVSLQYAGTGRFLERDESAHRAVIEARGKDKRGNGTASATITAQLTSEAAESTGVVVSTDLNITGRPAQFGRGVMQDVSDRLLAQFSSCLETELMGGDPHAGERVASGEAAAGGVTDAEAAPEGADSMSQADGEGVGGEAFNARADGYGAGGRAPTHRAAGAPPELNLAATVLPALLKRYAPYFAGGVVGLWAVRSVFRRLSRRDRAGP